MKTFRLLALASCFAAFLVTGACGDDDATVRPRLDAGAIDSGVTSDADVGALACGAVVPTKYESPGFAANAAVQLALAARFEEIEQKMRSTEVPDAGVVVTAAELKAIYNAGSPSLRAVSTTPAQSVVDAYFDAFEAALGKSWTPDDADQDGGAATGGKYGDWHFSPIGVDLREAAAKTLLQGAFYNHVVGIVARQLTEADVDSLLAAFGAMTALASPAGADAGGEGDKLIAEYASKRDDKQSATPGPYRNVMTALLKMKAAIPAGDRCKGDLQLAVNTFLAEWEKAVFGTAIYYLNSAATKIIAVQKPESLHAYGEALGFIQSFKGVPAERRKITDVQIDQLLEKIGATTPWKLVTGAGDRALQLNAAVSDIALYQGFTAAEVEAFKKSF